MKLNQYKEKKNHKKILIIIGAIMFFIGGIIVNKTFANFKMQKSFKVMEGNFIYEGSGDVIFTFYQDDKEVGTIPTKNSGYVFNTNKSFCNNNAKIKWNSSDWSISIKNLNKEKTKCNLYFSHFETLRIVRATNNEGMWKYRDKLTKIVIETAKNKKEAKNGQTVYGPYDESVNKDSSIESYVVCDTGDTNCIGYLQGDGGIALNSDSSYLFYNFKKVTQMEGIENLYTSNVTNMYQMFYYMESLEKLDLSSWDTSNVTNMSGMFWFVKKLQILTFSENFDTSSVTNMSSMFSSMSNLQTLDLSEFDTINVKSMESMFSSASKLTKITYGPNFIRLKRNTYMGDGIKEMFWNCPANKPDENVHSSWKGVYFG